MEKRKGPGREASSAIPAQDETEKVLGRESCQREAEAQRGNPGPGDLSEPPLSSTGTGPWS